MKFRVRSVKKIISVAVAVSFLQIPSAVLQKKAEAAQKADLYREMYFCDFEGGQALTVRGVQAYDNVPISIESNIAEDSLKAGNNMWRMRKTDQNVGVVSADIDIGDTVQYDGAKYIISMDLRTDAVPANDNYISVKASGSASKDVSGIIGAHGQGGLHLAAINGDEETMRCSYADNIADGDWWGEYVAAKNSAVTVKVNEWFNVTMEIDTTNNEIKYYYNGVYAGAKTGDDVGVGLKDGIKTLQVQSWQGWNDYVEMYIDNVSVLKECGAADGFSGIDRIYLKDNMKKIVLQASQSMESVGGVSLYNESKSCGTGAGYTASGNSLTIETSDALSETDIYSITGTGVDLSGNFSASTTEGKLTYVYANMYDSAGNAVVSSPPSDGAISVKAKVLNYSGKTESCDVIAASYNQGILVSVAVENVVADGLVAEKEFLFDAGDADSVKTFVWNSVDKCVPAEREVPYTNPEIFRIEMPFDDGTADGGFTQISGDCKTADDVIGRDGTFLYTKKTGANALRAFGRNVNTGIVHISFDYVAKSYQNKFWARLLGTGSSIQIFIDRGTIGYAKDVTGWEFSDNRAEYGKNEWSKIDVYVDFNGRAVYYYRNGVLYGRSFIPRSVAKINRLEFANESSYGDIALDNLVIRQTESEDITLPLELRETAYADTTSDNPGRIYFGKSGAAFNIIVGNKQRSTRDFVVKYRVLSGKTTVYTGESNVSVGAISSKTVTVTADTGGYGYFTLKTDIYDSTGKKVCSAPDYQFSAANVPEDGLKDESMGIQLTTNNEVDRNDASIDLSLVKKLGFSYTRGGLGFEAMDETGTVIMGEWSRKWYEECRDAGFDMKNILAFGNEKLTPENPPRSDEALGYFAEYALQYCALHKEVYGSAPKDLDVWNEYWMEGNVFNPDRATPEDYANMLKAVYTKVKPAYPETRIWGLSGVNIEHVDWVERVLKAGGGDYMDGYTLHPYFNLGTPEGANFKNITDTYKALFNKYGYYNKSVWISEWGWASVGKNGYPNEEEQAAYFVRANVFNKAYKLADMTNWYASNDVGNNNEQERRFGMLRGAYRQIGYEAKPIYLSAANYQSLMIGAVFVKSEKLSDGVTAYTFTLRDGRQAVVLWSVTGSETVSLAVNSNNMLMVDMYGNEKNISVSGGAVEVSCTRMPCYIVECKN